ncbi:MAG TPA: hypothetical protein VII38_21885 [Polyangia bacterium]|jgi:hypothetical protein
MGAPPLVVPADWESVGSTSNTEYKTKVGARDILIVLPHAGLRDDGRSARENADFQIQYSEAQGRPCAVIVLLGSLMSQDAEARRIYAASMVPAHFFAASLVVTSAISRAIGSFFLGLSRPHVPTKMWPDFTTAIAWAESVRPRPASPQPEAS